MTAWNDKHFPDAVDSKQVKYMVIEWRIQRDDNRCEDCGGNYSLYSSQFEDMPIGTTETEAIARFRQFKNNRREHVSDDPDAAVRQTLFLVKVVLHADITDDHNQLLADTMVAHDG